MANDSKSVVAARRFLEPDETLIGAFFGTIGPRPGVEVVSLFALVFTLFLTFSHLAAWVIFIAVFLGVAFRRRFVLVALTSKGIIQVESGLRRVPRDDAPVTRFPADSSLLYEDAGDPHVTVGNKKVWVGGADQDEARRLARLAAEHPGSSSSD